MFRACVQCTALIMLNMLIAIISMVHAARKCSTLSHTTLSVSNQTHRVSLTLDCRTSEFLARALFMHRGVKGHPSIIAQFNVESTLNQH